MTYQLNIAFDPAGLKAIDEAKQLVAISKILPGETRIWLVLHPFEMNSIYWVDFAVEASIESTPVAVGGGQPHPPVLLRSEMSGSGPALMPASSLDTPSGDAERVAIFLTGSGHADTAIPADALMVDISPDVPVSVAYLDATRGFAVMS
ncbi:hypothetical protein P1X14_04560 [Sphingomonas sp. AOB5]|uniref:hypothetical protein n=1 Tax=Sphingomonas sp. AOB5 TaxID=3034017 RepID=UPI0023F92E1F|nr:hypothetical protein [Sphingomonas sp. AOB5]MDF7774508.1 hypothetical protein [Sphingomonas sp. AOB5]